MNDQHLIEIQIVAAVI